MWPTIILTIELRQALTRALCLMIVVAALSVIVSVVGVGASWILFVEGRGVLFRAVFAPILLCIVLGHGARLVLWAWRTCDRCGYRLFPLGDTPLGGVTRHLETRTPDYRAERFLGSLFWGAVVATAVKGGAHCPWCGHLDGAKTDYVVTSSR